MTSTDDRQAAELQVELERVCPDCEHQVLDCHCPTDSWAVCVDALGYDPRVGGVR